MSRSYAPTAEAISAHLEGEAVLLHLGSRRYFRLNETAAELWAGLERGIADPAALAAMLCESFDVHAPEAHAEVARLLDELESRGLVQGTDPL